MGVDINMTREFVRLPEFDKQCKFIGLDEDDIKEIETAIMDNPNIGVLMPETGGVRKFRIVLPNRGKSGGARVVYVDFASFSITYLLSVFPKSDKVNLSRAERNAFRKLVGILKNELRKKGNL